MLTSRGSHPVPCRRSPAFDLTLATLLLLLAARPPLLPAAAPSDPRLAGHLLDRIAYGPARADLAEIEQLGNLGYLERQLAPESIDEAGNTALRAREEALFNYVQPAEEQHLIAAGELWHYRKGDVPPPAGWNQIEHDLTGWLLGPTGIGYGDEDDRTILDDMAGNYLSVYLGASSTSRRTARSTLPAPSWGRLEQAAMLLKRTSLQVVGLNTDGWDTHVNQGQINGYHGSLLLQLAQGFRALFRDLASIWDDLVVVTMTEFGRTSRENGSQGTDHAYATAVFVAGGAVRGGVYNCDAGTWAASDLFSQSRRYIRYRTDYRAVFAEIFTRHFNDSPTLLDRVIPGYSTLAQASPAQFAPLGFLEPAAPARSTTLDLY